MTVDGLLVDIDGVLTVSWQAIEGSRKALARLQSIGVPIKFLTNTTSQSRLEIARRLRDVGFEIVAADILNAPVVAAEYLRKEHPGARCLLINEGDLTVDLESVDLVDSPPADVVLLGGAGPAFSYQALDTAFRCLLEGAALVAMHRNLTWRTDHGLRLDSGGFVTALEESAGTKAVVVGKPSPDFFAAGLESVGFDAERIAMIGDDLVNDVLAAQAAGLTGILVRTGKFRPQQLESSVGTPDVILDSFADIPDWLGG